ncbi:hypothetical protein KKF55_01280 [Patescibacteria group bacterium]|nr:hypothetical protein [Patescibacteria group bacterium]
MKRLVLLLVVVLQSVACAQNRQIQRLPLVKVEPIARLASRPHSYPEQSMEEQLILRVEALEKKFEESNAMVLVLDGRTEFLNLKVKNLQDEIDFMRGMKPKPKTKPQQHRESMPVASGPIMYAACIPSFPLGNIEVSSTKKPVKYYKARLVVFGTLALVAIAFVIWNSYVQPEEENE